LDFHPFGPLKGALGGRQFADDDEKWCMTAFAINPKSFSLMASESLWTTALRRVRSRKTIWKSNITITFHSNFKCGKKVSAEQQRAKIGDIWPVK
jgi:hypothetical protein